MYKDKSNAQIRLHGISLCPEDTRATLFRHLSVTHWRERPNAGALSRAMPEGYALVIEAYLEYYRRH